MAVITPNFWSDDGTNLYPKADRGVSFSSIKSNVTVPDPIVTEYLPYGDFESYGLYEIPTDWDWTSASNGETDYSKIYKSEDADTGDYALGLECYHEVSPYGHLTVGLEGGDDAWGNEDTIQITGRIKADVGTPSAMLYIETLVAGDTYLYAFSGTNIGTWQLRSAIPIEETLKEITITEAYTSFDTGVITTPAGSSETYFVLYGVGANGEKILLDNVEVKLNGVNQATNSTMESWQDSMWEAIDIEDNGNTVEFVTDSHSGTYALKSTNAGVGPTTIEFAAEGLSADTEYPVSMWGKISVGDTIYTWVLDGQLGEATSYWDGTQWLAMDNPSQLASGEAVGTITEQVYTEIASDVTTSSGEYEKNIYIYTQIVGGTAVGTVDDFSVGKTEYPNFSVFTEYSDVGIDDMDDNQMIESVLLADSFVGRRLNAAGKYKTDFDSFDFSDKGINTIQGTGTISGGQPLQSELTAIFGSPEDLGNGYIGIGTNGAGAVIAIVMNGTWWVSGLTEAPTE
jgi:hypothetical protein